MNSVVDKVCPRLLTDELLRVARIDRDWIEVVRLPDNSYQARSKVDSFVRKLWVSGADAFSNFALSIWLVDGPKVFRPTPDQARAMEQVEINIELSDYAQPYPAILIELPSGYEPFHSVLCHRHDTSKFVTCVSHSEGHLNDITTTIAVDGRPMEVSVHKYDDDLQSLAKTCGRALRVALNSCLCLVNYGCRKERMFAKQCISDSSLAGEQSERACRARERLKVSPYLITFDQEVVLHETRKQSDRDPLAEPTGREVATHWRRGHWRMQPHGPNNTLRKRMLIKPMLIRADKFVGEKSDTSTVYSIGGTK